MGGILSRKDFKSAFPEPRQYEPRRFDDEVCRTSMFELQEWYARDYEKFASEETQFYKEHAKILKRLKTFDMSLVDNTDFITWAVTTPNPNFMDESLS